MLWYHESKSPITVQRNFRREYGRPPPDSKSIVAWYAKFKESGSVFDLPRTGRPSVSEEKVEVVRQAFVRSPSKSTRRASSELGIPQSTVNKILNKKLRLHAYKVQILHHLQPDDCPRRAAFATEILQRIENDNEYLQRVCFSDEATFHTSGKVNRHNVRIWGSENPNFTREEIRDSPKVNVWCGLMHNKIIGPFFFAELSITGNIYLDMLQHFVIPQLNDLQPRVIFQQDGAPPHWALAVRDFLNEVYPGRWIGRDGPTPWPPRSPDITPLDFFLWGYVKDRVYATPVPDLNTLRRRITEIVASVTQDMLTNTWREIDYRLDVLRATKGAHIEIY